MKAIYQPKGKAGEYAKYACNFFVGCSNECTYCYLRKGIGKATLGGNKPTLKKCFKDEADALEVFEKELKANLPELQKNGIFFTFTSDPMLDETIKLTWEAAYCAMVNDVPVQILTKCVGNWVNQLIIEVHQSWKKFVSIGFTLTGHDELEQNASTNADRIQAMKHLHSAGFKTFASIEPVINFASSLKMINDTIGFCDLYKIGLESGKKYDKKVLKLFAYKCMGMGVTNACKKKIYFKDSIIKAIGWTREYASRFECCVDSSYKLHNNKYE